jgi:hypothetical protein
MHSQYAQHNPLKHLILTANKKMIRQLTTISVKENLPLQMSHEEVQEVPTERVIIIHTLGKLFSEKNQTCL